jgi:hypothetical protein
MLRQTSTARKRKTTVDPAMTTTTTRQTASQNKMKKTTQSQQQQRQQTQLANSTNSTVRATHSTSHSISNTSKPSSSTYHSSKDDSTASSSTSRSSTDADMTGDNDVVNDDDAIGVEDAGAGTVHDQCSLGASNISTVVQPQPPLPPPPPLTVAEFVSHSSKTGSISSLSDDTGPIGQVTALLFKKKKFFKGDDDMKSDGKVAKFFYKHLPQSEEYKSHWWNSHRLAIRKGLDFRRGNCAVNIKREFISKCLY